MTMEPHLYQKNNTFSQWSTGAAYLYPLYEVGLYKLITGVECEFLAINTKEIALLDTGAEIRTNYHRRHFGPGKNLPGSDYQIGAV
jgi:hypothetical protein